MKKCILIFLFILNPTCTHTAEKQPSSITPFSWNSYITSAIKWLSPWNQESYKESELASNLRAQTNIFKQQLELNETIRSHLAMHAQMPIFHVIKETLFDENIINNNPTDFLQYCYYQQFHKENRIYWCMEIEKLDKHNHPYFLEKCQNIRINSYSALGAAMLAPNISFKERRQFIRKLLIRKFSPTPNDIQLANLILYDEIMKQEQSKELITKNIKTKFLYLLGPNSPESWYKLPHELKKLIALNMFEILKKEENCWLLPGF